MKTYEPHVEVDNVTIAYPLLGARVRKQVQGEKVEGAGSIIKSVDGLSQSVVALSDVSFTLNEGDKLGIMGRNGSGKSTLLRLIGGIYKPQVGSVSVTGTIAPLFAAGLGIQPEASGYRNIELLGLMAGYSKQKVADRLPYIVEFSGLGQYLDMPVRTYSNGMAMRLKFACSTAFEPDILLLDEWLGAGDEAFRTKAKKRMEEIVQAAGILVLASHSEKLLQEECNLGAWLHKGRLNAFGPIQDVISEYNSFRLGKKTV